MFLLVISLLIQDVLGGAGANLGPKEKDHLRVRPRGATGHQSFQSESLSFQRPGPRRPFECSSNGFDWKIDMASLGHAPVVGSAACGVTQDEEEEPGPGGPVRFWIHGELWRHLVEHVVHKKAKGVAMWQNIWEAAS